MRVTLSSPFLRLTALSFLFLTHNPLPEIINTNAAADYSLLGLDEHNYLFESAGLLLCDEVQTSVSGLSTFTVPQLSKIREIIHPGNLAFNPQQKAALASMLIANIAHLSKGYSKSDMTKGESVTL